jgi:biopolymer transport protein ExbD
VFKRPSSRRNSHGDHAELPLVPILDTMVTLIGFLLFTTSFLGIVSIESPLPQASSDDVQEQIKEKPLQLTLTFREKDVEIWSPFSKIEPKAIPNAKGGEPDAKAIHEALIEIKKKFPMESSAVLVPTKDSLYDGMVALMDAVRTIEPTDPPIYVKNEKTGVDEPVKSLFPKILFGNLLGDS